MKLPILGILLASLYLNAFAAQGRWTEGYGQGNFEYFIDQGVMRLYIGCPTQNGSADALSNVTVSNLKNDQEVQNFAIKVNGVSYDGPFTAGSRVDSDNFRSLLENLRKGNAVVTFGQTSVKFPKSNAAKVIPVGKKMQCNVFW
jgi:hypothetical protein